MKILFSDYENYKNKWGFHLLVKELQKLGVICKFIKFDNRKKRNSYWDLLFPNPKWILNYIRDDSDIVFVNIPYMPLLTSRITKVFKKHKSLIWLHGEIWSELETNLHYRRGIHKINTYLEYLELKLSIQSLDLICPCCIWLKNKVKMHCKSQKNHILYNGVDFQRFYPQKSEIRNQYNCDFLLLSVFNLEVPLKVKGLLYFLKKYMEKLQKYDYIWLICGSGQFLPYFKNVFEKKYNNIKFLGYIKDIEEYYRACDFLIHPSSWDCFPLALLEANACGKPVISTKVGGIGEIIQEGESGFLAKNFEIFYKNILNFFEYRYDCKEFKSNSIRNANRFNWNRIAKRLLDKINDKFF